MTEFNEMVMNPDIQEAESYKYSSDVSIVLPLESGKYALFGPHRKLFTIADNWFDLGMALTSREYRDWVSGEVKRLPVSPAIQVEDVLNEVKVDLGDIEL